MEDKTMKKTYTTPEIQVIMIQQQGYLLTGSKSGFTRTDIQRFETTNRKDELNFEFEFDGFDDDELDL